jgi:hypothetical protein
MARPDDSVKTGKRVLTPSPFRAEQQLWGMALRLPGFSGVRAVPRTATIAELAEGASAEASRPTAPAPPATAPALRTLTRRPAAVDEDQGVQLAGHGILVDARGVGAN